MIYPSRQDTLVALHAAKTTDELWAVLVTPHGINSSAAWDEAFVLFRRFHKHNGEGAALTAVLLCTDHRWRRAAHLLIRRLADSGLLTDEDLDALAEQFTSREVTVTTVSGRSLSQPVWPPLRRWAAARLVNNDGSAWRSLLDQATAEPSRDGAALAAGVMDAAKAIPLDQQLTATEEGLVWGSGIVRLAALPALARVVGDEAAIRRAQDDPNVKVRRWSPGSVDTGKNPAPDTERASGTGAGDHGSRQPSLFDTPGSARVEHPHSSTQ